MEKQAMEPKTVEVHNHYYHNIPSDSDGLLQVVVLF